MRAILCGVCLCVAAGAASAQPAVAEYRSRNFVLRTDLSAREAGEWLEKLETMLRGVSRYWGKRNRGTIPIAIVADAAKWPGGAIPAEAYGMVTSGGGITFGRARSVGGRVVDSATTAWASVGDGTPLHEAVHAYCYMNFGRTGPVWYAEGMAELGAYWVAGDEASVHASERTCRYLRETPIQSFNEIINGAQRTGDSAEKYAWRWALCHMLATNPNYADRFRPLGLNFLTGRPDSFERTYGTVAREIEFEYRRFIAVVAPGVRADLMAWDWKKRARALRPGKTRSVSVRAKAGWRPAGVKVRAGERYGLSAEGSWEIGPGRAVTADGEGDVGRLVGAVFDPRGYVLGEAFDLGAEAEFAAAADGELVLRCGEAWDGLGDNGGSVKVAISRME